MSRTSDTTGFLCPVIGCGGKCGTNDTRPAPYASRTKRRRYCRKCKARFPTVEIVSGPIEVQHSLSIETEYIDGAGI